MATLERHIKEGSPEAFAAVFRRFYAPLVRYARRFVDNSDAPDVVQDVFLTLWEQRHRTEVRASIQAMLYTMTRNRALNVKRRQKRTARDLAVEDARREQGEYAPPSSEAVEAEDLRRLIHQWIGELPERRAEAFTLSRYHHLTHEEIAGVMQVSTRTVNTHIYHALCDLRQRLDAVQGKR